MRNISQDICGCFLYSIYSFHSCLRRFYYQLGCSAVGYTGVICFVNFFWRALMGFN
jgi:hypothetical protein